MYAAPGLAAAAAAVVTAVAAASWRYVVFLLLIISLPLLYTDTWNYYTRYFTTIVMAIVLSGGSGCCCCFLLALQYLTTEKKVQWFNRNSYIHGIWLLMQCSSLIVLLIVCYLTNMIHEFLFCFDRTYDLTCFVLQVSNTLGNETILLFIVIEEYI